MIRGTCRAVPVLAPIRCNDKGQRWYNSRHLSAQQVYDADQNRRPEAICPTALWSQVEKLFCFCTSLYTMRIRFILSISSFVVPLPICILLLEFDRCLTVWCTLKKSLVHTYRLQINDFRALHPHLVVFLFINFLIQPSSFY